MRTTLAIAAMMALMTLTQGCSDRSKSTISKSECDALGGKLVNGQCQKEVSPEQMKSICDSQNLVYSEKFNGCIAK